MLPVSDRFLAALRGSHRIAVTAVLTDPPGQIGVDPVGDLLPIIEGTVTLDGTAAVRGSLDLTVAATWPDTTTTADLVPYGSEVFITRGLDLGNGTFERAPLGYFRLTDVEQSDPGSPIRVSGQDRMGGIIDSRLLSPVQYPATATYASVINALVLEVYPGATINYTWPPGYSAATTIGRTVVAEEDRHAFIDDLVTGLGMIWFWDYRGHLVIKAPPAPTGPATWTADPGRDGVLVSVGRSRNRDGVHNAVVARGEALDDQAPVYAVAMDDDPSSVTYWYGPYGQVPRFYSSPLITTTAQAQSAADSLLAQETGMPYEVAFTQIVNPALEPFDVVELIHPGPPETTETHVLDGLSIPLSPDGVMPCRTRLSVI